MLQITTIKLIPISLLLIGSLIVNNSLFAKQEETVYTENKLGIMVTQAQPQFTIKLKSNPTTGYSWFLRDYNASFIQPIKHSFEKPADTKLIGAPSSEVWVFRVKENVFKVPQQTLIHFVYSRPWEGQEQSKQVVFKISAMGVY